MRHHNQNRKLGRVRKVRKMLLNSLARSLVLSQRIKTTEAKAKELRPFLEKIITRLKKGDISSKRFAKAKIGNDALKILTENISQRYSDKTSGFLRIIKMKKRLSDGASMSIIEFV